MSFRDGCARLIGGCGRVGEMNDDRYFAFLRAINTGKRRLSNEQLLAPFEAMGFSDVAAYQAAGNVTFRCDDRERSTNGRSSQRLPTAYGFETPAFVRSTAELACDRCCRAVHA